MCPLPLPKAGEDEQRGGQGSHLDFGFVEGERRSTAVSASFGTWGFSSQLLIIFLVQIIFV